MSNEKMIILLVEDDQGDQELTRRAFENDNASCELHVVGDGEAAMDYLLRRGKYNDTSVFPQPNLILLDLNLPKLSGMELLKLIKAKPEIAHTPVVVLTTSSQDEDVVLSYKAGASSFITKPVDMERLFEVIKVLSEYWFETVALPPKDKT